MNPTPKPIGILGGTFDPIHYGHLRLGLELCQILNLAEIRFIPCQQPVHKNTVVASAQHRLLMLELAIAQTGQFIADDRELQRKTPSYMVDTLGSLRKEFPGRPLCLILGSDAFLGLPTWHRWQRLLELAHIIVALRPGWELDPFLELKSALDNHQVSDAQDLHDTPAGGIYIQAITALDITSTAIRSQLQAGYDPSYLLPDGVLSYIMQHRVYNLP